MTHKCLEIQLCVVLWRECHKMAKISEDFGYMVSCTLM